MKRDLGISSPVRRSPSPGGIGRGGLREVLGTILSVVLVGSSLALAAPTYGLPGQSVRDIAIGEPRDAAAPFDEVNITLPKGVSPHADVWDAAAGGFAVTDVGYNEVFLYNATEARISTTGPVGEDPSGIAFDPLHRLLWVVNPDSYTESVLNATTLQTLGTVALPTSAYAVAADPDLEESLIALRNLNEVALTSSGTVLGTVGVGQAPVDVAVDPSTGLGYVADANNASVTVVRLSPLQVVTTFRVAAQPTGVALDPTRDLLFVSSSLSGTLNVYNTTNGASVANITTGLGGGRVAICPSEGWVVVPAYTTAQVSLVSEATMSVVATYATPLGPFGVAFDGSCSRLLITDEFSDSDTLLFAPGFSPFGTISGTVSPPGVNDSLVVDETYVALSPSGAFRDQLLPGTYWLNASSPGYGGFSQPFTLAPGQSLVVSISLTPPPAPFPTQLVLDVVAVGAAMVIVVVLLFVWKQRRDRKYHVVPKDDPIRRL